MSRKLVPWLLGASVAALTGLTAVPASADVLIPIDPNQHFEGYVNGKTDSAIITTGPCLLTPDGPIAHPLPNQHVHVSLDPVSDGFTGTAAHGIDVNIPSATVVNPPITLHAYNQPTLIPTTLIVPCTGSRTVTFVPTPTSPTAVTESVSVTFLPVLPPSPA